MKELGNGYAYRMSDDAMVINMVNDSVRKRRQEAENRELLAQDHRRREAREQGRWQRKERRAIAQCCGGGAVIALTYFEMCRGNITPQLAVSLIIGALVFVCVRGGWYLSESRGRRG